MIKDDLYHLINYFAQNKSDYFNSVCIRNLRKHFIEAEKNMQAQNPESDISEIAEDNDFLRTDSLLKNVLIQRSRKYVKQSEGLVKKTPASF